MQKTYAALQALSEKLNDVYVRLTDFESLLICLSSVGDSRPVWEHLPCAIGAVVDPLQHIEEALCDARAELSKLVEKNRPE